MPKVRHFAAMEDSHDYEDLKRSHGRRKAVKEESRNGTEEERPSKRTRKKLRVCDSTLDTLPYPGKFMKLDEIFEIVRTTEKVLPSVPPGIKNNVFFVIEDSKNALRRERNLPVSYWDSCGLSSNKGNNGTIYVQYNEGRIIYLKTKDNLFCIPTYDQNKTFLTPMKPQPDFKSLIRVCRYYSKLSNNIKRRVTSVSGIGFKDRALFEYISNDTRMMNDICDNTSKCTHRSVRPKPEKELDTYDSAEADIETNHRRVRKKRTKAKRNKCSIPEMVIKKEEDDSDPGSNEMLEEEEDEHKIPINLMETSNVKIPREVSSKVHDEDLVMIAMLEESPIVQAVINRKNKSPSVILYNDKQFCDMKRNLEFGSVLGIDCTYKFGDCFVTMTVYENSRALHKETNEPLLYLGPVFLHSDEEFLTYMSFFSHIMDKLEDTELNFEVKLGHDLEVSLFRALKHSFPSSVQMVNAHHLQCLVNKHLHDVTDGKTKIRPTILQKIFGPKGIISSPSLSVFEDRIMDLEGCFDDFPSLKTYFDKLQLFLYPYICEPRQRGLSQKLWANGNDEVLNELLHTFLKCRLHKMSDIVESITTITRLQMIKLDNA